MAVPTGYAGTGPLMYGGGDSGAALLAVDAMAPDSPYRPAMVSAANVAVNQDGQPVVLSMPAAAGRFQLRYFYVTSLAGPLVLLVTGSRNGVPAGPAEQVALDPAQPRQLVLLSTASFGSVDFVSLTPVDPRANGTYSNSTTLFGIDNISLLVILASPPPDMPPVVLAAPPPAVPMSPPPASPPSVVLVSPPPAHNLVAGGAVSPPPQKQPSPPPAEPAVPPPVQLLSPPPFVNHPPPAALLSPPPIVLHSPPPTSPPPPPPKVAASPPPVQSPPTPPPDAQSRALGFDDGSAPPGQPVPDGYGGNPGVSYGNGSNPRCPRAVRGHRCRPWRACRGRRRLWRLR